MNRSPTIAHDALPLRDHAQVLLDEATRASADKVSHAVYSNFDMIQLRRRETVSYSVQLYQTRLRLFRFKQHERIWNRPNV